MKKLFFLVLLFYANAEEFSLQAENGGTIFAKKKYASYNKATVKFQGVSLKCDTLEVYFDDDKKIYKIIALNNVDIKYANYHATCNKATGFLTTKTIHLEQTPILKGEENDIINSKKIILLYNKDKVKATKVTGSLILKKEDTNKENPLPLQ